MTDGEAFASYQFPANEPDNDTCDRLPVIFLWIRPSISIEWVVDER